MGIDKLEEIGYNKDKLGSERRKIMPLIFVIYIIVSLIFGFIGMANAKVNKVNYSMIIALFMLMVSPIVAHYCGLY